MTVRRFLSAAALTVGLSMVVNAASWAAKPAPRVEVLSVRAVQPIPGSELSSRQLNTVTASTELAFTVRVRNAGSALVRSEKVALTLGRPATQGGPIVHVATVDRLAPQQTTSLVFHALGQVPFAARTVLTVIPRGGHARTYPVIFALPGGGAAASRAAVGVHADVVGLEQQAAINRLHALGLGVYLVEVYSQRPTGAVVAQSPNPGSSIKRGTVVTIDVSQGRPPGGG